MRFSFRRAGAAVKFTGVLAVACALIPGAVTAQRCEAMDEPPSRDTLAFDAVVDSAAVARVLESGWAAPWGPILASVLYGGGGAWDGLPVSGSGVPDGDLRAITDLLRLNLRHETWPEGPRVITLLLGDADSFGPIVLTRARMCMPKLLNAPDVERLLRKLQDVLDLPEADVELSILVSKDGIVGDVKLTEGSRFAGVNSAAVQAVQIMRFVPAMAERIPVATWVTLPISFSHR